MQTEDSWDDCRSYLFAFAWIAGWLASSPWIMSSSGPLLVFFMMLGLLALGWESLRNRRWLTACLAALLVFVFNPWSLPDENVPLLVYAIAYECGLTICVVASCPLHLRRRPRWFSRWLANL